MYQMRIKVTAPKPNFRIRAKDPISTAPIKKNSLGLFSERFRLLNFKLIIGILETISQHKIKSIPMKKMGFSVVVKLRVSFKKNTPDSLKNKNSGSDATNRAMAGMGSP